MAQKNSTGAAPGARLVFLDNLRVYLTLLVIAHHAMITYSSTGGWYYREGRGDTLTTVVSGIFCGVNQAYFMSFFFMISAYFTVAALERKGAGPFVRDRLMRLGIPLLGFDLLINPLIMWTLAVRFSGYSGSFPGFLWDFTTRMRAGIGTGPLWFVLALLVFTLAYVGVRVLNRSLARPAKPGPRVPGARALGAFIIGFGVLAFAVRLWIPVGGEIPFINFQIAYFPLYIGLFCAGILAWRGQWFAALPDAAGPRWAAVAAASIVLMPVVLIAGGALQGRDYLFLGGPNWQALVYAMWEPVMCVSMIAWLTILFRKRLNRAGALQKFLSQNAYAMYIVHAPVLVFLGLWLRPVPWHPLAKFAVLYGLAVPACCAVSVLVRKLPGARRVL